jgi:hypothetical protein
VLDRPDPPRLSTKRRIGPDLLDHRVDHRVDHRDRTLLGA